MKKTRSLDLSGGSVFKSAALGVLVSYLTTIVLAIFITIFITNEYIDITSSTAYVVGSMFVSIFVGSTVAGFCTDNNKIIVSFSVGAVYVLIGICFAMLFCDGINSTIYLGVIVCICASLGSVYVSKTRKNGNIKKRKKGSRR